MNIKQGLYFGVAAMAMISCTTSKKLKDSEKKYTRLDSINSVVRYEYAKCKESHAADSARIKSLEEQIDQYKHTSTQMQTQLKDLSFISGSQAESIKKSMDNIGVKDQYITRLQSALNKKDSMNIALMVNLKSAIGNLDDKDVNIKVDKGVVYVDISDKLLFKSGSYEVTDHAKEVLGKVAKVLMSQPEVEFMVEGHTDDAAFKRSPLEDNWDLSTKRATSVVRILQNTYHMPPAKMTAAGRGEYVPVADNETKEGKAANRRTRIVILPQLDQFYKILEKPTN